MPLAHHKFILALLIVRPVAALLSDAYRLQSPCPPSVASMLLPVQKLEVIEENSPESYHWVAAMPVPQPLGSISMTSIPLAMPSTLVGAPAAVGRLDLTRGQIDFLRTELPKENPEAADLIGLIVDGLLLAWCQHCSSSDRKYEHLTASASPFVAPLLVSRGFALIDDPDFTALGRGELIATHRARLPASIIAYQRRAASDPTEDVLDRSMAEELLAALRDQPEPGVAGEKDDGSPDAAPDAAPPTAAPEEDRWASLKRLNGF